MMYRISQLVFEYTVRLLFKVRVHGKENVPNAPYIAVCNHVSLADPPMVATACKKDHVDFLAKRELFDAPFFGGWASSVNCIPVDRGANSGSSLKEALRRIKRGRVVGVFPEGTRSSDGAPQKAKQGIGFLIAKAGVPVLPIHVVGSGEAYPKGKGAKLGAPIDVFVGKPIEPGDFLKKIGPDKRDYGAISDMIMGHIAHLNKDTIDG